MRLGQLSRLVNIKPTEIISILKEEYNIEIGTHLNTKVDDEWSDKIIEKYAPKLNEAEPLLPKAESQPEEVKTTPETTELIAEQKTEPKATEIVVAPLADEEGTEQPTSEPVLEFDREAEIDSETISSAPLIKAEKVVLEGPKVVGKIELPEPPAPQMVEIDGVLYSKDELAKQKREKRKAKASKLADRKPRTSKTVRGSIKKSEAQIEQIKRDAEAQALADKIAHREKRIEAKRKAAKKAATKTTAPKKKKKSAVKAKPAPEKVIASTTPPENLSVLGKIWKWFNT